MKSPKKFDGVVDAVRLGPDGRLARARVFQSLGATYSDHVILTREQLVDQMKQGKHYGFGQRKETWGFTFEPSIELRLVKENGQDYIRSNSGGGTGDDLKGLPLF